MNVIPGRPNDLGADHGMDDATEWIGSIVQNRTKIEQWIPSCFCDFMG